MAAPNRRSIAFVRSATSPCSSFLGSIAGSSWTSRSIRAWSTRPSECSLEARQALRSCVKRPAISGSESVSSEKWLTFHVATPIRIGPGASRLTLARRFSTERCDAGASSSPSSSSEASSATSLCRFGGSPFSFSLPLLLLGAGGDSLCLPRLTGLQDGQGVWTRHPRYRCPWGQVISSSVASAVPLRRHDSHKLAPIRRPCHRGPA